MTKRNEFIHNFMQVLFEGISAAINQGVDEVEEVKYGTKDHRVIYVTIMGREYSLTLHEFGGHPGGRRYPNLSTNADSIIVGAPITQAQVDSLAFAENEFVENRAHVSISAIEGIFHAFMCEAVGECVCTHTRKFIDAGGQK